MTFCSVRDLQLLVIGAAVCAMTTVAPAQGRQWIWMGGESTVNHAPAYPAAHGMTGDPGSRRIEMNWTGLDGNFYIYSGQHIPSLSNRSYFADVWKYDPRTLEWSWVSGPPNSGDHDYPPSHGMAGLPGRRVTAGFCRDSNGNAWLMGGNGPGIMIRNDLWKRDVATGEWIWMWGGNGHHIPMIVPDNPGEVGEPGSLAGSFNSLFLVANRDNDLLMMGGWNQDGGPILTPNYTWKYDVSENHWVWLGGSVNTVYPDAPGEAGEVGERNMSSTGFDSDGNLWLYGGDASDSAPNSYKSRTDLWMFDIETERWLWIDGEKNSSPELTYPENYGEPGHPGKRNMAKLWRGVNGDIWLFGGVRNYTDVINETLHFYESSDLWRFDMTARQWIWEGGPKDLEDALPQFPAAHNQLGQPPALMEQAIWQDTDGNIWMYGGVANYNEEQRGDYNAIWKLEINQSTAANDWQLWE